MERAPVQADGVRRGSCVAASLHPNVRSGIARRRRVPHHDRMRWMVLVALAGCSGTAAYAIDGDDDVDAGEERDSGASTTRPDASSSSSSSTSSSGSSTSSSSSSSGSTSSSSSSSGGEEDAGSDASEEPDSSVADAAPDAPPPVCDDGQQRCVSYAEQQCVAGQWSPKSGEACCFTVGRYVGNDENWKQDSQTGLSVHRDVRTGPTYAGAVGYCFTEALGQLPTAAQLLSQILPSGGACIPGLDQGFFRAIGADPNPSEPVFYVMSTPANDPAAPPKCINTTTGNEVACSTSARPAYICVRP